MKTPPVQHIAIEIDGGVAVMLFITETDDGSARDATDEAVTAELCRSGFAGKTWARVDQKDIPTDRATRSKWRLRDGKIVVEGL